MNCIPAEVWNDADAAFFAEQLAQSDYVAEVGGALRDLLGPLASLADVGAGSGILGLSLLRPGAEWIAYEPNAFMRGLIAAAARPDLRLTLRETCWQALEGEAAGLAEVALCANIPGTTGQAAALYEATRRLARRALVWVVSAQAGPRTFCLSGFLPDELHGLDTTPGYRLTLEELGVARAPCALRLVDWTFTARFASRAAARQHFVRKLGIGRDPDRLRRLDRHLDEALRPEGGQWRAEAPKRSALLLWHI